MRTTMTSGGLPSIQAVSQSGTALYGVCSCPYLDYGWRYSYSLAHSFVRLAVQSNSPISRQISVSEDNRCYCTVYWIVVKVCRYRWGQPGRLLRQTATLFRLGQVRKDITGVTSLLPCPAGLTIGLQLSDKKPVRLGRLLSSQRELQKAETEDIDGYEWWILQHHKRRPHRNSKMFMQSLVLCF
jgi:hypothetical protein